MFSALSVSESTGRLVLSYPLWTGIVFAALAVCAIGYAALARRRIRRHWPLIAAAVVSSWAALYFTTFDATVTNEGSSVYGFLRYDRHVRWMDARDIYLERQGGDWTIVVRDSHDRPYELSVGDLSIEDRNRVMAYMVDRMPADAFHRDTTVLKREGEGPRPVSFSSDQQI